MSNPMRTLLVGLGARGKKWARILKEEPTVETVGYVDILDDNLEWAKVFDPVAKKSAYHSMEKALSELQPEFVVLVTPPIDRYKDVITIFEHGSHLLSEKPLSLDLDEGLSMVKAAQEAKVGFAVGLNFRYQHCVTEARAILKSGEIGKPGLVGLVTGTIAGLATITPASGYVDPKSAFIIGVLAGSICWYCSVLIKQTFNIDDSLDVFAVHGVGGMLGIVLVGFLANEAIGGTAGSWAQAKVQITGVIAVAALSIVATYIIVKIVQAVIGLRVSSKEAQDGLDITTHGERGYHL